MRIIDLFHTGSPVFSIEIFPPKTEEGMETLKIRLMEFKKSHPDFISVTYGAGGGTRHNTHELASYIKNQMQIEALAHLTCVSHTKAEINLVLDHLAQSKIENIMALRGDPLKNEERFQKPQDGFEYASELITAIRQRKEFGIGGAGYPEGHPEAENIEKHFEHFLIKVAAGADFIITQLFLDNDLFLKWRDRVRSHGIKIPLIAGVMPPLSAQQITRFASTCGCTIPEPLLSKLKRYESDTEAMRQVGLDFAQTQIEGLIEEGVEGVHLYALNRLQAVQRLAPIFKKNETAS
ncbi:MAG: methylenetetrahydrofolate reductase [NAD(P)H] [SAR324 cluster bacterium]|nr:methylenetetrahydrofolate reductase [NAD(P)H] [SAR324 cluster bacterium]